MGFDIKEALDDINPSKKTLKWMVIGLFSLLSGLLAYDGLKPDDSKDIIANQEKKISILQTRCVNLKMKLDDLVSGLEKTNSNIDASNLETKSYIDNRIKFVVSNSDKNKQYVLDVLEMSEKLRIEKSSITEKFVEIPVKSKNIIVTKIDSCNNTPIKLKEMAIDNSWSISKESDTTAKSKKGLLKKLFSIF